MVVSAQCGEVVRWRALMRGRAKSPFFGCLLSRLTDFFFPFFFLCCWFFSPSLLFYHCIHNELGRQRVPRGRVPRHHRDGPDQGQRRQRRVYALQDHHRGLLRVILLFFFALSRPSNASIFITITSLVRWGEKTISHRRHSPSTSSAWCLCTGATTSL